MIVFPLRGHWSKFLRTGLTLSSRVGVMLETHSQVIMSGRIDINAVESLALASSGGFSGPELSGSRHLALVMNLIEVPPVALKILP